MENEALDGLFWQVELPAATQSSQNFMMPSTSAVRAPRKCHMHNKLYIIYVLFIPVALTMEVQLTDSYSWRYLDVFKAVFVINSRECQVTGLALAALK